MSKDLGIYRNAFLRLDSSVVEPHNSADKLLLHEKEDSKLKMSLQILAMGSENSEYLSPIPLLARQMSLFSETRARMVLMLDFLNLQSKQLTVNFVQIDLRQRFPMYHMSSVCQAAGKSRG